LNLTLNNDIVSSLVIAIAAWRSLIFGFFFSSELLLPLLQVSLLHYHHRGCLTTKHTDYFTAPVPHQTDHQTAPETAVKEALMTGFCGTFKES
jgi:hypothetical protein